MFRLITLFALVACSIGSTVYRSNYEGKRPAKQWALLVATSKGWDNYRHQADICHAYHVLRSNGIPAENIVTMVYDDIANNTENPFKGSVFNRPSGPDVYQGCVKDYTGAEINVKNTINVLTGKKEAMKGIGTGRVIESGPDDHIFVNIVDHGTVGALCFPNNEYMYADQLADVLKGMRKEKKFAKMVIYLEACEGGSMFDNIIGDRDGIFVTTAAATNENSFAYYCEYSTYDACLGDFYSITWMEQMDLLRESWSDRYVTLFKQYRHVRTNVNKSRVMMYGDFRLGFDRLSHFLGDDGSTKRTLPASNEAPELKMPSEPVSSRDVKLYMLRRRLSATNDDETREKIEAEISTIEKNRQLIDDAMDRILIEVAGSDRKLLKDVSQTRQVMTQDKFPCYRKLVDDLNAYCFNTHENPYSLNHFFKMANLCHWEEAAARWTDAVLSGCPASLKNIKGTY